MKDVAADRGSLTGSAAAPRRRAAGPGRRGAGEPPRDGGARTRITRRGVGEAGVRRRPVSEAQDHKRAAVAVRGRRRGRSILPGHHARGWRRANVGYLLLLVVCAGSFGWMWEHGSDGVRGGTLAMSGALLVASAARLVLPESRIGMIASRKRFTDVITLAALAVGLLVASLALPMSP